VQFVAKGDVVADSQLALESVIYQEWDVREEQHTHLRDANKQ